MKPILRMGCRCIQKYLHVINNLINFCAIPGLPAPVKQKHVGNILIMITPLTMVPWSSGGRPVGNMLPQCAACTVLHPDCFLSFKVITNMVFIFVPFAHSALKACTIGPDAQHAQTHTHTHSTHPICNINDKASAGTLDREPFCVYCPFGLDHNLSRLSG